MFDEVTQH